MAHSRLYVPYMVLCTGDASDEQQVKSPPFTQLRIQCEAYVAKGSFLKMKMYAHTSLT